MDKSWTIEEIAFGSPLYALALAFRDEHLRRPLGLSQSAEDIAGESAQYHIAALDDGQIVGTVVLKPVSPTLLKLRQMAVAPLLRGTGLGASIVRFAEATAQQRGFAEIEMTARVGAEGFYEKLGYAAAGEAFLEVTIPHVRMTKRLA